MTTRRLIRIVGGLILALASGSISRAQADFTFEYAPKRLGSADKWGYAIWRTALGQISLNSQNIPINLVFSSDPRIAAGIVGKGWNLPFFDSALVEEGQGTLRWHRPDGRIFYFSRERGDTSVKQTRRDAPEEFLSGSNAWRAERTPKTRHVVLTHVRTGAQLIYEDGLLVRFCLVNPSGDGAQSYSVSYDAFRNPVRLSVFGSGKVLAEFDCGGGRLAKTLRIGDKTIPFAYIDASLNQFPAGPYLSQVVEGALSPLSINYKSEGSNANGIRFERLLTSGAKTGMIWTAGSGFLREDDSGTYKVENPSLANNGRAAVPSKGRNQTAPTDYNWKPDEAKITRTDRQGKSEYAYNDRAKGIDTRTNKEGVATITYYLLTPGPMMGRVRKIEEVKGKQVTVMERNAYDEQGRMVRKIDKEGAQTVWEYLNGGDLVRQIVNGTLTNEKVYENGVFLARRNYGIDGIKSYVSSSALKKLGVTAADVENLFKSKNNED